MENQRITLSNPCACHDCNSVVVIVNVLLELLVLSLIVSRQVVRSLLIGTSFRSFSAPCMLRGGLKLILTTQCKAPTVIIVAKLQALHLVHHLLRHPHQQASVPAAAAGPPAVPTDEQWRGHLSPWPQPSDRLRVLP